MLHFLLPYITLFHSYYIMHVFKKKFCYHRYTIPKSTIQFRTKIFHLTFGLAMSLWKCVSRVTKEGHPKKVSLWITIFFKWETHATKYHIYPITDLLANILTDKLLYSDLSFQKKTEKSWLVALQLIMLHFDLQRMSQLRHEKIKLFLKKS